MGWPSRIKTNIGLDIGSHSIKLVEVRYTPKGVFLANSSVKELGLETRGVRSDVFAIAEKIKELFFDQNIKARKVTIGVSGPQVAIRHFTLPSMPEDELKEAVRWEVRKFISFPVERAIVGYQILGETIEDGAKKLDLMVAAAEAQFIENQLDVIKNAGLKPVRISTVPHALWNSMQIISEAKDEVTALIDIGATKTSINIVKDNMLKLTREICTAGDSLTEAIQDAATLEGITFGFVDAEKIKKEFGIPEEEDIERANGRVPLQKISFAMRPVLERLLTEIKRSFEFYESRFNEAKVERILISGGSARLKGLRDYLGDQLGTEVELLNPFEDTVPELAIATGLALRRTKEINLLPENYRLAPKFLMQKYAPAAFGCLAFLVLFGMYLNMNVACTKYRRGLTIKQAKLADLQSANTRLIQLKENKERLDREMALLPKGIREIAPWEDILREISHVVPEKTTLTGLFFPTEGTAEELRLKAVAFGDDAEIVRSIVEFMEGLEKSPFFTDVRLSYSEENDEYSEQGADFELLCKIETSSTTFGIQGTNGV